MKNLNKVLAMLVVFMMVVSTVAFASFTDVAEDSAYDIAIEVGTDLGLFTGYDDGSFKPEGEITRAEFAAIVVRMKGQDAQAEGAKSATMFTDVPADHWAAGYINIAVRLGIINGYGDGNFGPSDLVEYQDAITMMVRALGYEPAIGAAGYPTGYLTKAGELKLTDGVDGINGVAINRGKVAQIVFNSLDVPLMTQSGYGTFTQYVVNDGKSATTGEDNVKKTLLSENHNIALVIGTVEASSVTEASTTETVTLDITNKLDNSLDINLGSNRVFVGSTDIANYVGKKVFAFIYVNEFEGIKTLKSFYEAPIAETLVVDIQDVADIAWGTYDDDNNLSTPAVFDPSTYFKGNFEYYNENGRKATVLVRGEENKDSNGRPNGTYQSPKVYVNGVLYTDINNQSAYRYDALEGGTLSGTIEFALLNTTNASAEYDTVYINAVKPFVVDEVKTNSSTVKGKLAGAVGWVSSINFDADDAAVSATLYDAEGEEMDWEDLEENDVLMLSYIETASKAIYVAEVATNVVEGKVDNTFGNPGDQQTRKVTIGGETYKVLKGVEAYDWVDTNNGNITVHENGATSHKLEANDEGIFYLDANNNIVFFDLNAGISKNYGYVINAYYDSSSGGFAAPQIQILTKDNEVKIYDFAKKIRYNNAGVITPSYEVKTNWSSAFESYLEGKVITYNVNSADQVTAIFTPQAWSTNSKDSDFTIATPNSNNSNAGKLVNYDPDDMTFGKYSIDENTVIFYEDQTHPEDSKVVAVPALMEDDELTGVSIYNLTDEDYVSCMIIRGTTTIGRNQENAVFVLNISEGVDEDGDTIYTVYGIRNGEEVELIAKADPRDLNPGTRRVVGRLAVPEYNVDGTISGFKLVDTSDYVTDEPVNPGASSPKVIRYRELISVKGSTLTVYDGVSLENDGVTPKYDTYKVRNNTNVYLYDETKESTGRGHYMTDADGYIDYDTNSSLGLYYGNKTGEKNLDMDVYIYDNDGKEADILYVIRDITGPSNNN